jgi:hypothetical protein
MSPKREADMAKKKTRMQDDDENQTRCWTATNGHIWMKGYFDTLPAAVRQRLRQSPFNLCPACLVAFFLPEVPFQHPREKALFKAIEVMEAEVRKGQSMAAGYRPPGRS